MIDDPVGSASERRVATRLPGVLAPRRVDLAALPPEELAAALARIAEAFAPVREALQQMITALGAWAIQVNEWLRPLLEGLEPADPDEEFDEDDAGWSGDAFS